MNIRPDLISRRTGPKTEDVANPPNPDPQRADPPPPQIRPLRILLLEDSPPHAELVEHFLRDSGLKFEVARVDTREAFATAALVQLQLAVASLAVHRGLDSRAILADEADVVGHEQWAGA